MAIGEIKDQLQNNLAQCNEFSLEDLAQNRAGKMSDSQM